MKVKKEHLAHMKKALDEYAESHGGWQALVSQYEQGRFPNSAQVRNLQTRFCWEMAWAALSSKWICDTLYPYCNDDHIMTALKSICPKVIRHYK